MLELCNNINVSKIAVSNIDKTALAFLDCNIISSNSNHAVNLQARLQKQLHFYLEILLHIILSCQTEVLHTNLQSHAETLRRNVNIQTGSMHTELILQEKSTANL